MELVRQDEGKVRVIPCNSYGLSDIDISKGPLYVTDERRREQFEQANDVAKLKKYVRKNVD